MWINEYLDRALRIANASGVSPETIRAWNALEDELLGKLNLADVAALRAAAAAMPHMGAGVILAMLDA